MTGTESRRRPGGARPDGPLLERSQIVDAALALTRRYGLDGMSMRKLGDELGVTSMAIYWYFKSKDDLIDAVTERVLGLIELPDPEGSWQDRLTQLSWAVHAVLIDYPGIADQIYTYQNYPASALPLLEYGVAALREAGFCEGDAAEALNVLASVVITRSHFEAYQLLVGRKDGQPSSSVEDRVKQGWHRLDDVMTDSVPNARSYVEHLDAAGAGEQVFARAVEVVIRGLEAQQADLQS